MSQAAHLQPWPRLFPMRAEVKIDPWLLATCSLGVFALALRLAAADQQSAYMDEGTNVLTGRLLIEQHTVYAEILNWAYGSLLWPLIAGAADELGGLRLVRGVSAACGVVMVLATASTAARLAPRDVPDTRRRAIALLAGGIMAIAPGAIAVGRFGTYDAMSGAAFMLGVALLVPPARATSPVRLLAAAALLFVAFLAKYLVAIYFPFVCLFVVLSAGKNLRLAGHKLLWFVGPLTAACAAYALIYLGPLLLLLTSSLHYGDLKSPDPLREYVWTRPELVLLVAAAAVGWRRASWSGRLVAGGGSAIIVAFQLAARADFDFWKHSIYAVYFLAPMAALSWLSVPQNTGTWRVVAAASAGVVALWTWSPAVRLASRDIDFYPNLNLSLSAIEANITDSALILTDDSALRYYLYPRMETDRVVGPFFFTYRAQEGLEAYRLAITDRFFDAIVLDGGVTPQGAAIRRQLGPTVQDFYQRVYSETDPGGFTVEVFKPVRPQGARSEGTPEQPWPVAYTFENGESLEAWGAHPEASHWEPGLQLAVTEEHAWEGHASLRFTPTLDASILSLRRAGHVARMRARIKLVPADGSSTPIRVGFIGFDENWRWHDDGYRWLVPPGTWTTVSWELAIPANYEEVGLKFPAAVTQAYIGTFEIDP